MGRIKGQRKVCRNCHLELPVEKFSRDRTTKDGFAWQCKDCHVQYRKENADRIRAHDKQYQKENADRIRAYNKQYKKENSDRLREYRKNSDRLREYRKENFFKRAAHHILQYAVKKGEIVKLCRCQSCGQSDVNLDAHHPDYSKPLEVMWFCRSCHGQLHALENRKLG